MTDDSRTVLFHIDSDEPESDTGSVFTIEPVVDRFRYLFDGGQIMDVDSPYAANSNDRAAVLEEALRRWGGKKEDWRIEGVARLWSRDD